MLAQQKGSSSSSLSLLFLLLFPRLPSSLSPLLRFLHDPFSNIAFPSICCSVVPPSPEREKGERPEKLLGKHMEAEKLSRRSSLSILRRSTNGSREHQQSKDDSKIESSSGPRSMVDTPPALSSSLPSPPTLRELAQVQAAAAAVTASPNKRRTSLSSMLLRGSTPNLNTLTTTSEKRESQSSFRHKTTAELSLSPRGTLLTDDEDDWIEDPVNEELRRDTTKVCRFFLSHSIHLLSFCSAPSFSFSFSFFHPLILILGAYRAFVLSKRCWCQT
jgi:hypothetical protein